MPSHQEEIGAWAMVLALVAGINWCLGHRTLTGRPLRLRRGVAWSASRWGGLGLYLLSRALSAPLDRPGWLDWAALAGSCLMLLGTARRSVGEPGGIRGKPPAGKDG